MYYYNDMPFESEQSALNTMGSIKMFYAGDPRTGFVENSRVKHRRYVLLSTDIAKLANINNAADGSVALAVDTGDKYVLHNNSWVKQLSTGVDDVVWTPIAQS